MREVAAKIQADGSRWRSGKVSPETIQNTPIRDIEAVVRTVWESLTARYHKGQKSEDAIAAARRTTQRDQRKRTVRTFGP